MLRPLAEVVIRLLAAEVEAEETESVEAAEEVEGTCEEVDATCARPELVDVDTVDTVG